MKALAVTITDCGDLAVLLPIAALLGVVLWRIESRAAAWAWMQALIVCVFATFALKIGFLTCGHAWGASIRSPSGHASMSMIVYGALALVVAAQTALPRTVIFASAALWICAIALTRTTLHAHTPTEVALGLAVGVLSLCVFAWKYRRLAHPRISLLPIAAGIVCVFALLYGSRLPAEKLLYRLAHTVRTQGFVCARNAPNNS
jgi:membrane-associated phospholipid phosphatase